MSEQKPFEGPAPTDEVRRTDTAPAEPSSLTFEAALAELETIVQKLERGQLSLEESIAAYERGTRLRQHCAAKLRDAQLRVEKLALDRGGEPVLTPFEEA